MKRLLNCCTPIDSILEDKELMETHVDLQNVSRYTMCVPNAWQPFFAARRYEESLNNPSGIGCDRKDTGRLVTWEFPRRTDSAS